MYVYLSYASNEQHGMIFSRHMLTISIIYIYDHHQGGGIFGRHIYQISRVDICDISYSTGNIVVYKSALRAYFYQ